MNEKSVPRFVEYEFDSIDRNVARCPQHPDRGLTIEAEQYDDCLYKCSLCEYRAIARDPSMHGLGSINAVNWAPPLRRVM